MIKRLLAVLLAVLLASPALAQIPGGGATITINSTPVSGGTNGQCLFINSGTVGAETCVSSSSGTSSLGSAGNIIASTLATPGQVSATPVGSGTLNTSYRYVVQACGAACTAASAPMTNPVTSFATLDATHVNQLTVVPVTGALFYRFYRTQGGSSVGFVGQCSSDNCTVNDNNSTTTKDTPAMATVDTGSAGLALTGPLTVFTPTYNSESAVGDNQAGNAQFGGHFVYAWGAHDTAVGTNVILTGKMAGSPPAPAGGYNRLLLWDIGASSTITFQGSSGTYENPVSEGSGYGYLASNNYVTSFAGGSGAFIAMSGMDFGGYGLDSGSGMATDHDMFGRQQHWVESGRWGGVDNSSNGQGNAMTSRKNYLGSAVWNTVNDLYTNDVGSVWHHVGYSVTAENSDITSTYEAAYRGWKPVSTAITAMSWAANQITLQITAAHSGTATLKSGQWVAITGSIGATRANEYNGNWRVVSDDGTNIVLAGNVLNPGTATTLGTAAFGGNVFYDGPMAGASGTVWPWNLTGSYIRLDQNIIAVKALTTWANNQTCTAGQMTWDASFIYVCTATNTVKRATLAAF